MQDLYSFLKLCTAHEKKDKAHSAITGCTSLKFLLEEREKCFYLVIFLKYSLKYIHIDAYKSHKCYD